MWRHSGAWGRGQASEAVARIGASLNAKEAELTSRIEKAKAPAKNVNPWVSAYGAAYNAGRASGIRTLEKQLKAVKQAQAANEQAKREITEANLEAEASEKAAVKEPEQSPYTEDDLEVPKERQPVEEPKVSKVEVEEPEAEVPAPKANEPQVDAPKTPEQPTDIPEHEATFNDLKERIDKVNLVESGSTEAPAIGVEANALKLERETKLGAVIHHVFVNKNNDAGQIANAVELVKFIRKLNTQVLDNVKTPGGKMVLSQRKDASEFDLTQRTSARAREEDFRLGELQKALEARLNGQDEADLDNLYQSFLNTVPEARAEGKKKGKSAKESYEKKLQEEIEATPEKVAEREAKELKGLQKKLTKLQKRFGDDSKLKPKTAKQKKVSDEVRDLKERIKFHQDNERDAIRLNERLKERERLLAVETGPLGAQRSEVTKVKRPTKTPGKLEKVDADIAFLKKNMRDRLNEIDNAREDMSRVTEAVDLHAKEISKLDDELEKLRKQFGDTEGLDARAEAKEGAPKPEKSPDIAEREAKIKFHKEAQAEALLLAKKIKERNRLLEVETGPLGGQRAEVTKPTKTSKKADGEVETLNEQINFLRANMRKRVQEIDKAREEMTPGFQAAKIAKAHQLQVARLDKELEEARKRFGDINEAQARADEKAGKPKAEKHPEIADREARLKFHKDAEKEALELIKLEKELARVADIEARGIMGELRSESKPKVEGPKKPLKSEELRKKINESKARMRQKIKDIDKAEAKMRQEEENLRVMKAVEAHLYEVMLKDTGSTTVNIAKQLLALRQLSLIDQPSSATAGVGTGIAGFFKQMTRPSGTFIHDLFKEGLSTATRNARADAFGLAVMLKNWEGTGRAVVRTFKNSQSATGGTGNRNRLTDEKDYKRRVDHRNLKSAIANAKRQVEAKNNIKNYLTSAPLGRTIWTMYELGMRGIMALDEIPRRQFLKGQQTAEALQAGIKAYPNDRKKAQEHAEELYNSWWKDDEGIQVLSTVGEQQNSTDYVNRELLFASNATDIDESEIALTAADAILKKVWRPLTNLEDWQGISLAARFLAPFMSVALRGGGRLARVGIPGLAVLNTTNLPVVGNKYIQKLKVVNTDIEAANVRLRESNRTPKQEADDLNEIKLLQEKKERIETRKIMANKDAITDALLGGTFFALPFMAGFAGGGTAFVGSQAWMTEDQRETYGGKEFTMFGWSFKDWIPISLALALGADLSAYYRIRDQERKLKVKILNEDQDEISVLKSSALSLIKELPFNSIIKDVSDMTSIHASITNQAIAKQLGSIFPNPAIVKKLTKYFADGGKVPDLKGMDFEDRVVYELFGTGIKNYKTDHFGDDKETEKSAGQMVWRSLPDRDKEITSFDKLLQSDWFSDIRKPPTTFKGVEMKDFVREDGVTLLYAFNRKLRKTKVKKTINKIISDKGWQEWFKTGASETSTEGEFSNPALSSLNETFGIFHDQVSAEIESDKALLKSFTSDKKNKKGTDAYNKYGPRQTLQQVLDYKYTVSGAPNKVEQKPLEELLNQ